MPLRLLAFASAAVSLGWRERTAQAAPGDTPRSLLREIAPDFDPGAARVAVDCEYRSWDDPLGPAARELAILPPVSGG
jgi:molybdopterin synthase sulfur carrier subunit